jgi:hypothetical protein
MDMREYDEALRLLNHAHKIWDATYGPSHVQTVTASNNIANLYDRTTFVALF